VRASEDAYVYAIGSRSGPVKIGYSTDPAKRLKTLQAKSDCELFVLGKWAIHGRRALCIERYVHWLLRDKHFTGEWFNASREEAAEAVRLAMAEEDLDQVYPIPRVWTMRRQLRDGENITTKFPKGTRARLHAACGDDYAEFVRSTVEAELKRRERQKP